MVAIAPTADGTREENPAEDAGWLPELEPAKAAIVRMTWLLSDARKGVFLGGRVLTAIVIGIALEAAFAPAVVVRSGVVAVSVLGCSITSCLTAMSLLVRAGAPLLNVLSELRWRSGALVNTRAPWPTLVQPGKPADAWSWTRAHQLLSAARQVRARTRFASTWTLVTAACFLSWTVVLFLGI